MYLMDDKWQQVGHINARMDEIVSTHIVKGSTFERPRTTYF